ncbi:hypothetical protein DBR06_SOUSAS68310002, partial [Sousa chinensis]
PWTQCLLPAVNPHPQFGGPVSLFSTHGCGKCSMLRNHSSHIPVPVLKAVPRTPPHLNKLILSPYTHWKNSPTYSDNSFA